MKRVAMLLVATGIAGAASAHDNKHQPDGCSAIEITAPGVRKQPRDGRFSTLKILDLDFETRLEQPVYGDHVMRFKVFTPSGFLYQELNVPFTWPRPRRGHKGDRDDVQAVPVAASYPAAVPMQVLGDSDGRSGRRRDTLSTRLPVAGTSITMSTLYGLWAVQAFLDDRQRPCSSVRRFTIHSK
jgi:hypothetical protein